MKKVLAIIITAISVNNINAQLFSSGNNIISGSNVGVNTPAPATKLHVTTASGVEALRLESKDTANVTRFTMVNDAGFGSRATFTRYGSKFPGSYPGLGTKFPYPNLLAFGCNVGSFLIATNGNLGLSVAGGGTVKLKFFADASLNVGIGGDATPVTNIHLNNTDGGVDSIAITNNTSGHTSTDGFVIGNNGNTAFLWNKENAAINFGTNNINRMVLNANGQLIIGTANTINNYKLIVEQGILTEKVKVAVKNTTDWSDYVFAPNYKLMPLTSVAAYIQQHKHLPNVPSAEQVVAEGIDVATMDAKLLEKVEELTLYLIQLDKENNELKKRIDLLEKK